MLTGSIWTSCPQLPPASFSRARLARPIEMQAQTALTAYRSPRTDVHWTAVSATRGASRAPELAAKVTSAQEVLPTSGLLATGMESPNIERILAVN